MKNKRGESMGSKAADIEKEKAKAGVERGRPVKIFIYKLGNLSSIPSQL